MLHLYITPSKTLWNRKTQVKNSLESTTTYEIRQQDIIHSTGVSKYLYTVKLLYTDIRSNDKIRYNDSLNGTVSLSENEADNSR